MKITKTIDVSDYADEAIKNFDKFIGMTNDQIKAMLEGQGAVDKATKKAEDAEYLVKKIIAKLRERDDRYMRLSHNEMADALQKVANDMGLKV